jgi:RNA polymerase sigma factor (TIGR02999 family)
VFPIFNCLNCLHENLKILVTLWLRQMSTLGPVTDLLRASARGDSAAEAEVMSLVYNELRHRAARYMRRERSDHTLQPTALVHETWLRLRGQECDWRNRSQFFGVAARQMRRILLDHARKRQSYKWAAIEDRVSFSSALATAKERPSELVAIDDALHRFARHYPRQAKTVELRFFGGYSEDEVAGILEISVETVKRDWRFAKTWLSRDLRQTG